MATTLGDLITEALSHLESYTGSRAQRTGTAADIAASGAVTFAVEDGKQVTQGLIEIDDELMHVSSVSTNSVTVPAWGRGQGGTTPAAHATGTVVLNDPDFPRGRIRQIVNEVVSSLYPTLYQIKATSLTAVANQLGYALPVDCDDVLSIKWSVPGVVNNWHQISHYDVDTNADTATYPSGRALYLYEGMIPGRPIRVSYFAPLGTFAADTDTLATVGLAESARDVVLYGTLARALASLEAARLQTKAPSASMRDQVVQPGAATQASRAMLALFQLRLAEEQARLQSLNDVTVQISRF